MTNDLIIREVHLEDAVRLVEIYSYYVLNTAVSFEYTVPTTEEFEDRIRHIVEKYPYLVCEVKYNELITNKDIQGVNIINGDEFMIYYKPGILSEKIDELVEGIE